MKVKICGITNTIDALLCERLGADAIGFIFYKESKRYVLPEEARKISASLSPFTARVGVFVNEDPELINRVSKTAGLNWIQLHGDEAPSLISELNLPVIKSFRVDDQFDFDLTYKFENCWHLLDSSSDVQYGGTGKTFDWNLIPDKIRSRIILSGGVSALNIDVIRNKIKPLAIDLSSSVEEYPGKKSEKKLKEIFQILKGNK